LRDCQGGIRRHLGLVELGYRQAPRHDEVRQFYRNLAERRVPIYTTDYVLDEVVTLLFRREVFDEAAGLTNQWPCHQCHPAVDVPRTVRERRTISPIAFRGKHTGQASGTRTAGLTNQWPCHQCHPAGFPLATAAAARL